MNKLLVEYRKIGAINSKATNIIWKSGIIMCSISYCSNILNNKNVHYSLVSYFFMMIILFIFCEIIFISSVAKRLNVRYKLRNIIKLSFIRKIYKEIEKYQKTWITNYCKKNKINTFNKLNILKVELENENKQNTIKYINPIIIGTLSLTIWEIAIEKIVEKIGFGNMLLIAFIAMIGISVLIGVITKNIFEDKEFFYEFERFSNKKRLEELLLYRMLRSKE